jgi:signal transduction histidine kinase/CheY-like chemotaxis protein
MPTLAISSISLHYEYDLVAARRRARQVARLLGFDDQDQTRIATVASEISRNALRYAGGGRIEFALLSDDDMQSLVMTVTDHGAGIENLDDILAGRYRSNTGMGLGLIGARRLMDGFEIVTAPGKGTTVTMRKALPRAARRLTKPMIGSLADELARQKPDNPLEEIQQQNAELLAALAEVNDRRQELERLNQELEDTNRGVLALYAEIDEKAEHLRQADQLKTRFLSDMSHEFRTPVNAILALARLLEESVTEEEGRKQLSLIMRAGDDLASLVNDLLDLAKIEAGKIEVRPAEFEVSNLFSALRGMLRPLLVNRSVSLVFDDPEDIPEMFTDEGKVSQILRNFMSNALKFTEAGEIRVSAQLAGDGTRVIFSVADTGIGIAPEDQQRIFEEFTQVDSPLQRKIKGTGLGLPLTRKLAHLLGGEVRLESQLNLGSTFIAEIPVIYPHAAAVPPRRVEGSGMLKVLIIDDDDTARYTVGSFAARPGTQIIEAENGMAGIARAQTSSPDVILLDMMMPGLGGHEVLQRLKGDSATASIPVVMVTSRFVNDEEKRQILTKAVDVIYKGDLSREVVTSTIDRALASEPKP